MSAREIAIMAPLVILTVLLGFYPKPVLDTSSGAVNAMIAPYKQAVAAQQITHTAAAVAQLQK
jgi:NADH-quinone oxidoreductase subunit M